jgi:alkylated DNA repair protein alkB family protein 4
VALLRINEHLDSGACGTAAPPPPPRTQRPPPPLPPPPPAAAPSSSAAAPLPCDADESAAAPLPPSAPPSVPLAVALRWSADAVPVARRYGQHTGRATGMLPPAPAPPPPDSAAAALLAAHARDGDGDGDDDGAAFREHFRDDDDDSGAAAGAASALASAPAPAPAAPSPQLTYGLRGHLVLLDFLSAEEEASLLRAVEASDAPPWRPSRFNGKSRGKAWGADMSLAHRAVYPARVPFPAWLAPLVARLRAAHPLLRRFEPNHVNAIEYVRARGDHLSAHVDDRQLSGDIIVNLSLAGECTMTYAPEARGGGAVRGCEAARRRDAPAPPGPGVVRVPLPRRAAQVQSGAARFEFTHAICAADLHAPRRVSLTMRESPVTHARRPDDAHGTW